MTTRPASFRDAMRRLAATVTIVTTGAGERRHGMTATAVTSLSMDPPSLLVCVNRGGALHALLAQSDRFCVNLLRCGQAALSDAFAGRMPAEERFRHGDWRADAHGIPYLADAQATIFCTKQDAIRQASHTILIGAVESVGAADEVSPLLYGNGGYARCTPLAALA